jgi:stearoyl-CoA desaturase (delta-9 desaturase)
MLRASAADRIPAVSDVSDSGAAVHEPAPISVGQPWKHHWLWSAPGEVQTLAWMIAIHLGAVAALALVFVPGWPLPPWQALVIAFALLWFGGLGTTVAYHRCLAHKAVVLHPLVEQFLIFCAMINGSGNPRTWVSTHRHHHRYSDSDNDVSSPREGFMWAHLRWLWQAPMPDPDVYCPDLDKPRYRVWGKLQVVLVVLSYFGGLTYLAVADWRLALTAMLWIGPLRLVWALHAQCTINSVCHLGSMTAEGGSSINVWWLTPLHLCQGENWHANHHVVANDARLGRKLLQIDVGWYVIRALSLVGLAQKVRVGAKAV